MSTKQELDTKKQETAHSKNARAFYITTTLPYVNSDPHIGFAGEIIRADIIARFHKLLGEDVFFNTGTDEHGLKIYRNAVEKGEETQVYVDRYAERFRGLKELLGISPDINFIRTTDKHHIHAAQEFWKLCDKHGYIYKKNYEVKYCVGCELEKTDSELVDGKCPIHPNLTIELISEENYFFKFSAFQEKLLALYAKQKDFVIPDFRFNEIKAFVARGLEDFSISRLKSKMPWGIPVPNDDDQVMYVWFDALVNYISALGWPKDIEKFGRFWGNTEMPNAVQYAGKDNLRQQSAMWQAMLMAAELPPSKHIVIGGFVTSNGAKMSKSLGNVVDPYKVVEEYGTEALRYFMARELSPFEDGDFTFDRFKEAYNANLANGLGNLVSRIMKLATTHLSHAAEIKDGEFSEAYGHLLLAYDVQKAADYIWKEISDLDLLIQQEQPFRVVKEHPEIGQAMIRNLVHRLYSIAHLLTPFLPDTAKKIQELINGNKMPETPLFPRKD